MKVLTFRIRNAHIAGIVWNWPCRHRCFCCKWLHSTALYTEIISTKEDLSFEMSPLQIKFKREGFGVLTALFFSPLHLPCFQILNEKKNGLRSRHIIYARALKLTHMHMLPLVLMSEQKLVSESILCVMKRNVLNNLRPGKSVNEQHIFSEIQDICGV